MSTKITLDTTRSLYRGYDHFNEFLFENQLPPCAITFEAHPRSRGYFAPYRYGNQDQESMHLISMNSLDFVHRDPLLLWSTLVHEMCHLWQQGFGKPSRNGYHNLEWSRKMKSIGLMPSNTGEPGGKTTGQDMTHFILPIGGFSDAAKWFKATDHDSYEAIGLWGERRLIDMIVNPQPEGEDSEGEDSEGEDPKADKPKAKKNKVKYTCPECDSNVWGKAGLKVICGCKQNEQNGSKPMVAAE